MISTAAVADLAAATWAIGVGLGNFLERLARRRAKTRDVLAGLVTIIGGKPADALGPAVPGLIEQMRTNAEAIASLRDQMANHEDWHELGERRAH